MKEKLKLPALCLFAGVAIVLACVMAYRFFGPGTPLPKAKVVSIADLARQEKKDPSVLTDDERKLLATIPADQKQKLLDKPSFSLSNMPAPKTKDTK